MPQKSSAQDSNSSRPAHFATTRWSLVQAAGDIAVPTARAALADLCETYWYPVYAFVRRRGASPADAQDLTQEFFATLIEKGYVRSADPRRGRFRTFLLTAVSRFLSKQRERAGAQKRGGGRRPLSLDFESGERRYQLEPCDDWTPERLYERRWALTLLDRVLERLSGDAARTGKSEQFEHLKVYLTGTDGSPAYADLAAELSTSEGAIKVAVHRLRRRYRELLKQEIAETLAEADHLEDELTHLLNALRRGPRSLRR